MKIKRRAVVLAGNAYLIFLTYLLFFASFRQDTETSVNFIPFKSILEISRLYTFTTLEGIEHWLVNVPGNVIAFVPLPFILRSFYSKPLPAWVVALMVITFPLIIEASQFLFQRGSCDVDDWMLNCMGLLIGIRWMNVHAKKTRNKI